MARIYSSRKIGHLVGADPSSVNRWIDSGRLKAFRTPGGHRRVLYPDLLKFLDECGMPVPDELRSERRSVLLVDEDDGAIKTLKRALTRSERSIEVHSCTSGIEALIHIGAKRPDVVVLEVAMPGLDGVEVCKRLKASSTTQDVAVILVTERPAAGLEKRALQAGAMAFLEKPVKPAVLLDYIGKVPRPAVARG
ncbi:MAG: response regulator [Deltaproteobacteria bacterium]|nr:response regulator [Deltaproteobacteria bacterium]